MNFQTPSDICDLMAQMLLEDIGSGKLIIEPHPGRGNLVNALKRVGYRVFAPINFDDVADSERFAGAVMNPDFTPMEKGYKTLYRIMNMTNNIVALMPWLTIINSQKRTQKIIDFGLVSVTHLPRSVFPGSRVQTCILRMHKNADRKQAINLNFFHRR